MRNSILSAAFVAALGFTAWSPDQAKAQVVVSPSVVTSPYTYSSYWTPSYNYAYATTPYYNGWSYTTPYTYGTYGWYNYSPYYSAHPYGYMNWPNYVYRGYNRRLGW